MTGSCQGGCRMELGFLECTDALELDRSDGCITSGVKKGVRNAHLK